MFLKLFPRQFTDATALPAQPGRGVGPETRSFTYKAFRVLKGPVGCKTPPHRRKKAAPRVGGQQGSDRLRIQNKGDRIAACFSFGPVSKTVHLHDASFFWCGVPVCVCVCACLSGTQFSCSLERCHASGLKAFEHRPTAAVLYIMSIVLPLVEEGNGCPAPASNPPLPLPLDKPRIGDRVLVLREPWLMKVLTGEKTLEIRSRACRLGRTWLGREGKVYGSVDIVGTQPLTEQEFRDKGALHHWPAHEPPPYNKIVGWTLSGARALETPLPYWRPRTAIGWNVFREKEEDLPIQGRKKRAVAPESNAVDDGEGDGEAQAEQNKAQAGLK